MCIGMYRYNIIFEICKMLRNANILADMYIGMDKLYFKKLVFVK